jgi:hypothetical protein
MYGAVHYRYVFNQMFQGHNGFILGGKPSTGKSVGHIHVRLENYAGVLNIVAEYRFQQECHRSKRGKYKKGSVSLKLPLQWHRA